MIAEQQPIKHLLHLHITGLFNKKEGIDKDSDLFSKKIPDKIKIQLETSHIPLHITRKLSWRPYQRFHYRPLDIQIPLKRYRHRRFH